MDIRKYLVFGSAKTKQDVYKRQTTYWGIVIKKIKPITMIVLMTIIGIGGAYLGILG